MIGADDQQIFTRTFTPMDAGERTPILLFHDSLGCVALWRDFPDRLAQATGRTVIAYDRPGFGRSERRHDVLAPDFIAEEARTVVPALCEALEVSRFIACGHSVGGGMAVQTAARWPECIEVLITIAAQAFVEDRTLSGIREAKAAFAEPGALGRLERHHGVRARWVLDAWTETWLAPEFSGWTLDEALALVRAPTLAIHGSEDEFGSPRHPERIASGTGGQALLLPGTGHTPHRECPDLLVEKIAAFLTRLDAE